jgi:hypothetical protein
MQVLDSHLVSSVSGGDRWGAEPRDGTACANAVMAWGGMGSMIGGAIGGAFGGFSGMIGSLGGSLGGGALAARFALVCEV